MSLDKNTVRQVYELGKTAVNQEALAARIAENLANHQLESPPDWPTFALTNTPAHSEFAASPDLRLAVEQATQAYDKIWVDLSIAAADKSFLARIKRPFHELAAYYVNRLGQRQIKFNDRLLRLIHRLIATENRKDAEIQALQTQLSDLQARIQALEDNRK
jgi:hypothetical protein